MSALDLLLWDLLGDELDLVLPLPPPTPVFARETVRPAARAS